MTFDPAVLAAARAAAEVTLPGSTAFVLGAAVVELHAELTDALTVLDRVRDAFAFMPALHGAGGECEVDEVRQEVTGTLDHFTDALHELLRRPLTERLLGYRPWDNETAVVRR